MAHSRILFVAGAIAICSLSLGPCLAESPEGSPNSVSPDLARNWPQWRGPARDGYVAQGTVWPDRLDEGTLKPTWRVELGSSYSGPIVASHHVFVTETENGSNEVVRALDRGTGEEIWQAKWKGAMTVPFFAIANGSWIRATPAYDGESLFVAGMRDVLVCLDAESGDERWRVDFVSDFNRPLPAFGFVSSPLVLGDHVYVQAGSAFRKLDKRTGETVWSTLDDGGGMYGSAFSSPILATVAGKEQLLVQTREKLAGVDPQSGGALWSQKIQAFRGMNILTPTVYENSVFTSSYGGRAWLFRVSASEESMALDEVWTNETQAYMSTPVVIDDHAYIHLKNRRFGCIDLRNGERKWTSEPFGKYASLVANGDRILALDQRGELLLIRATPNQFDLLDRRRISTDSTWAHLAVCGNEVFVRELRAMAAYRWGGAL